MLKQLTTRDKSSALIGLNHRRVSSVRKRPLDKDGSEEPITFTLVSDENGGLKYNWWEDEYYVERLDIRGGSWKELRTFFKNHSVDVDDAIGRVQNVRFEDSGIVGEVVFGEDANSKKIETKYRSGILADVSIGYEILDYEVEKREGEMDLVTITDFNILELSAVGLGFDGGAIKREKENIMLKGKLAENEPTKEPTKEPIKGEATKKVEEIRSAVLPREDSARIKELELRIAENDRKEEVRRVCEEFSPSLELREKFLASGTVHELREAILNERKNSETPPRAYISSNGGQRDSMVKEMADGFAMRMGTKVENATREAEQFKMASLLDMGRALTGYTGFDRQELAKRTLVTPDFPILLESAGNRTLTQQFTEADNTYKQWVAEVDVKDFRTQTDISFGQGGELPRIYEGNNQLKEGDADTTHETWNIDSYGKKFTLTRQMLINDDLNALNALFVGFGDSAGRTVNAHVYRLLQNQGEYSSYKMGDGGGMWINSRNNSQNLALDSTNLGSAKKLMRKQTDISGNALNLAPKFLMVGADLEQTALQLLNSTADLADNKNAGVVNTHYRSVQPIIENAIAGDTWYLATNRRTLKLGFLQGTNRSPITNIIDTSIAGVTVEGVFDFGVMVEDFRGLVKGR